MLCRDPLDLVNEPVEESRFGTQVHHRATCHLLVAELGELRLLPAGSKMPPWPMSSSDQILAMRIPRFLDPWALRSVGPNDWRISCEGACGAAARDERPRQLHALVRPPALRAQTPIGRAPNSSRHRGLRFRRHRARGLGRGGGRAQAPSRENSHVEKSHGRRKPRVCRQEGR